MSNLATRFLQIKTNIFGKTKTNIICNLLFLRIKTNSGVIQYGIKISPDTIQIPSVFDVKKYEKLLFHHGTKLCNHTINSSYLKQEYLNSNLSFILFTTEELSGKQLRPRKSGSLHICGLLFLEKQDNNLYIPLICSKSGLGSKLLSLSENIGKLIKAKNLTLVSLENPLGFYLHQQYQLQSGKNTLAIKKAHPAVFRKTKKNNGNNSLSLNNQIRKLGHVTNNLGITRQISDLVAILPKNSDGTINKKRLEKLLYLNSKSKISFFRNVKLDNDNSTQVYMSKKL